MNSEIMKQMLGQIIARQDPSGIRPDKRSQVGLPHNEDAPKQSKEETVWEALKHEEDSASLPAVLVTEDGDGRFAHWGSHRSEVTVPCVCPCIMFFVSLSASVHLGSKIGFWHLQELLTDIAKREGLDISDAVTMSVADQVAGHNRLGGEFLEPILGFRDNCIQLVKEGHSVLNG